MAERLSTADARGEPAPIEISILGELEIRCSGAPIALKGSNVRHLVVSLVLDLGRPLPADVIIDRSWGATPPATARKSVQKAVWELRKALGWDVDGPLTTGERGYLLTLDADSLDANRFEALVGAASTAPSSEAIAMLQAAEGLWRGPALDGFAHLEWAQPTAVQLEERRIAAIERRLGLLIESGRHTDALPELEQLTIEHPLREELWAHLMTARSMGGRRKDALAAFQQVRHLLADELGIEPSSRLRDLERLILAGDLVVEATPAELPPKARPVATTGQRPAQDLHVNEPPSRRLPSWLSPIIGRDELLDQLGERLADARLTTLTGVGGSGKTRVAVEAARRIADGRRGEPHFIDLSTVEVDELVAPATATALGIGDGAGIELPLLVREMLAGRDALLIFDNCEHLIDAAATLIEDLLHHCPDLTVLTTSRKPLGIPGERVLPVPPLGLPDRGSSAPAALTAEAVELMVGRVREVDPTFELDRHNVDAVVELCTRLDGIPLAIELAAAQLPTISIADLLGHLDDRFRILGATTARPARQATLRATIDWSHRLLTPLERRTFERVSVFPATFDAAAARAVVDGVDEVEMLAVVGRLVRTSMAARSDRGSVRTRYRLLDTLRAYGREILAGRGELEACRQLHAEHFASVAERFEDPTASDGDSWHGELEADYPNLLAALEFAADGRPALLARLVYALSAFWVRTPDRVLDGLRYAAPLSDRDDLDASGRATALCAIAELRAESGESQRAGDDARRALASFEEIGDRAGATRARFALGRALVNGGRLDDGVALIEQSREQFATTGSIRWATSTMTLGFARRTQGDYDRARNAFAEMLGWASRHDLAYTAAKAEWLLGSVAHHRGSPTEARAHCRRALDAFDALGDRPGVAHVRMTLGDVSRADGDEESARDLYATAHETLSEIGDLRCIASAVKNIGDLERRRDPARAAALHLDCLERRHSLGDRSGMAEAFEGLAATLADTGHARAAAVLLGQAETLRAETGAVTLHVDEVQLANTRRAVAAALPAVEIDAARSSGAGSSLDDVLDHARTIVAEVAAIAPVAGGD